MTGKQISLNNKTSSILMENCDFEDIGLYLQYTRLFKNLAQIYVAKELNISRVTLSKLENGSSNTDLKTLFKLLKFYNVDITIKINKQ